VISSLEEFAKDSTGVPVLRTYWYDGTSTGPTAQHVALAFKPRVKVRLGFVNTAGQQKGVDSLIVTDMISLARNHAMSDAVLLSGDEDLRVGVQQAQEFGVCVHLLGICPARGSQSQFLLQEADATHEWGRDKVSTFLSHTPRATPANGTAALSATMLKAAAPVTTTSTVPMTRVVAQEQPKDLAALAVQAAGEVEKSVIDGILANYASTRQVPPQLDRKLLGTAKRCFGLLTPVQLRALREDYIAALNARSSQPSTT
jgi:hypothetical protein